MDKWSVSVLSALLMAADLSGQDMTTVTVYAIGLIKTNEELPAERDWVRSFCQALQSHARGSGSYVNSMTEFEDDRVRASYGPQKYARRTEIKRRYNPDNLFHLNPNIKPA